MSTHHIKEFTGLRIDRLRRPTPSGIVRCLWICVIVLLSACQSGPERREAAAKDQPEVNLTQAREQAEEAYAAGDWLAAEPHYLALLRALPQDQNYWFRLGNIYARTERPDAAVAAYREAAVRDAENGKIWFNMGIVQLRQAANSFLKMKVHVDPTDPIAVQGAEAYAGIMAILGESETSPVPAAD